MKRLVFLLLICVLSTAFASATAQGRYGNSFSAEQAKSARDKGDIVSLKTIFDNLRKRYGGYQLDAELFNENGQPVYVIDWQTEKGERVQFRINARTGRVLS